MIRILQGDMLVELPKLIASGERFHAVVTDPPYHLTANKKGGSGVRSLNLASPAGRSRITTGFMSKTWDGGDIAFRPETWRLVFDALLPGAHMLCFGGTRTCHRMACAIEDAGFELRDTLCWLYGSGFPKSLDISKALDRAAGAEREVVGLGRRHNSQRCAMAHGDTKRLSGGIPNITAPATPEAATWSGWGTALKPAFEPIILARKPLGERTVAANMQRYGTGGLNIDASRIGTETRTNSSAPGAKRNAFGEFASGTKTELHDYGRWPANVLHDGSEEVLSAFPDAPGQQARLTGNEPTSSGFSGAVYGKAKGRLGGYEPRGDNGSAARFFYTAKADSADRAGSKHPTVKPTALIHYLVRLITPPGGTVLDPFSGTGTTGLAADQLGFDAVLIEQDAQYVADAKRKITGDAPMFAEITTK